MITPVGYLVVGRPANYQGAYYNYIFAGSGVFINARNDLLTATVPVAPCSIRGLDEVAPSITLFNGRIPAYLFDLALNAMLASPEKESYIGIKWQDGYRLYMPEQKRSPAAVEFNEGENIILDLHSHGPMPARFSGTDNKDEQGLRIYGVVGKLDIQPILSLRVGVYGYFFPVKAEAIFDRPLDIEEAE